MHLIICAMRLRKRHCFTSSPSLKAPEPCDWSSKKMIAGRLFLITTLCAASIAVQGQEPSPTAQPQQQQPIMPAESGHNNVPLYRIQVVGRDIPAINYWHRSGSTKIGFAGTSLLPPGKRGGECHQQGADLHQRQVPGFRAGK
jgi:hypothetical protein